MEQALAKVEHKLPTLSEIINDTELSLRENKLTVLLNQPPPPQWLKKHPYATTKNENNETVPASFLPIDKQEYLLTKIYGRFWVEILDSKCIANSVEVTVRVFVKNPLTGEIEHNDGIGAVPIQTDAGKGAMDWNYAKSSGVMMAAPAAASYAQKDATERFGRIFGRDLNRREQINYMGLMKESVDKSDLVELYELKKDSLSDEEVFIAERIINNNEVASFTKLSNLLKSK